ncbi:MAG: cytochrome c3 family protein [Euryarchaeota archaeon]|nr:cytochrome c3 family protein [Euryarchaeota archaeon]
MKRTPMLLATLILLVVMISVSAEVEFDTTALYAKDVDCTKCHPENPHTIHEEELDAGKVTCEACHGEALEIAIPQCGKCHYGTIHNVHIKKVMTENCTYCHGDINTHHNNEILDTTVCAHCHRDLVDVHTGCEPCHKTAPDIVKPVQPAGVTILCQDCHTQKDLVHVHGEETDTSICYMCHRPKGDKEELEPDVIPHLIHLPDLATCEECHMPGGKVILPACSNCHDLTGLHLITVVPRTQRELHCSVCHPETEVPAVQKEIETPRVEEVAETPTAAPPEEEKPKKGVPGYEASLLAIAGLLAYTVRRMR